MFTIPDVSLMKRRKENCRYCVIQSEKLWAGKYKRFWIARIPYVKTLIVNIVVVVNIIAVCYCKMLFGIVRPQFSGTVRPEGKFCFSV